MKDISSVLETIGFLRLIKNFLDHVALLIIHDRHLETLYYLYPFFFTVSLVLLELPNLKKRFRSELYGEYRRKDHDSR